jgi:DNA modification methylase
MTWHPDMPLEYRNQIITGDARELARRIPNESVDLIFTDPVYWQIEDYAWLAETAARVLKPGASVIAYAGHMMQIEAAVAMYGKGLQAQPILTAWMSPPHFQIWKLKLLANYSFVLWFSHGTPKPSRWISGELGQSFQDKNFGHKWGKNFGSVSYYINTFIEPGALVLDPFTGGGTVPAVCKMLGRNYIAFEIDADTAETARQRVAQTQVPWFVEQPEQLKLDVSA